MRSVIAAGAAIGALATWACSDSTGPSRPLPRPLDAPMLVSTNFNGVSTIGLLPPDGTGYQQRLETYAVVGPLAWAPDYQRFAFVTYYDRTIRTVNRDGTNSKAIYTSTFGPIDGLSWSPDGTRLAFSACGIYTIRPDGSGLDTLLGPTEPLCASGPFAGTWSPDGRQIAFYRIANHVAALHVMNADGTGIRQLIGGLYVLGWKPNWSPDGRQIAVVSRQAGPQDIWVVDADGANPRRVTDATDAADSSPVWSPDGQRIAFIRGRFPSRVMIVDAAGGVPAEVGSPENASALTW